MWADEERNNLSLSSIALFEKQPKMPRQASMSAVVFDASKKSLFDRYTVT
jgi:hypothetical protein